MIPEKTEELPPTPFGLGHSVGHKSLEMLQGKVTSGQALPCPAAQLSSGHRFPTTAEVGLVFRGERLPT